MKWYDKFFKREITVYNGMKIITYISGDYEAFDKNGKKIDFKDVLFNCIKVVKQKKEIND